MEKKIIPVGSIGANCVVLWGEDKKAWIVDPGSEADRILNFLKGKGLSPVLIALTHGHFDHIGGIPGLLEKFPNLPVHVGPGDVPYIGDARNAWPPDYVQIEKPATLVADLVDGFELAAGGLSAKVVATPGHTPGGVCFKFEDAKLLLTGDTLFAGSCGRTDFPGGSMEVLSKSLKRLSALDPELMVIPGHGMPTTIAHENASNPFLQ